MLSKPFVNLFNWNPQLFREIKGRLKTRNVAIAISASLISQFIVMMVFREMLPPMFVQYCIQVRPYCTDIDWSHWWADIFITLSSILLTLMLIGGVYMLVADLAKEQRLGTLNFIRLSPQSSQKILLGKLLGVPILIYLAGAISLPLHLWANISSDLPLDWLFGFYGALVAACFFFYNASVFFVFLGVTQAWLAAAITGILLFPFILILQLYTDDIPNIIATYQMNVLLIGGAIIISGVILANYWIWQAVNRRYRNPNATVISKKQSYWLIGCFQVYLLLFFLVANIHNLTYVAEEYLIVFCTLNLFWFLLVIAMLSPQRQSIQDWARYRHQQVNNDETTIIKGAAISLKQDLIWSEKSPALVAIGINLVITAVMGISWILFWQDNTIKLSAILTLILSFNLILIYAAIAQFILLIKVKKPAIWAIGILGGLIFIQPLVLIIFITHPVQSPNLWLLSTFPWLSIGQDSLAIAPMLIAIISQWSILTLLTFLLTRKIQKLGASDSQKLLTGQKN
ncbi:MAG: hypothetical protein F6K39_12915 [Okeania sp. SIO3B3]|nr:hypothetical protein [Okeania sp. SIO3B3]